MIHSAALAVLSLGFAVPRPLEIEGINVTVVNTVPAAAQAKKSSAPVGPLPPVIQKTTPKIDPEQNKPKPPKQSRDGELEKIKTQPDQKREASSNASSQQRSQASKDREVTDVRRLLNTVEQLRSEIRTKGEENTAQKRAPNENDLVALEKALDTIVAEEKKGATGAPEAAPGQGLTPSDFDRLKRQLSQCWNIPAGAPGVQGITITIEIRLDPEGYVRTVDVHNRERMSDAVYRVLAESATRALWHPDCTPLLVPEIDYKIWQTITITFDPAWLLTGQSSDLAVA